MAIRAWVHFLAGLTVAGFFAYLFLVSADTRQLATALRSVDGADLAQALALLLASHCVRVMRWSWLLRPSNPAAGFGACLIPYGSSVAVNNLVPFRAGDIYRVVGFSRRLGSPKGQILGTVLAERLLDLAVLTSFAAAGLPAAWHGPAGASFARESWVPVCGAGLAGLAALSFAPRLARAYRRSHPAAANAAGGLSARIHRLAAQFACAIESLGKPSVWLPAVALTALAWLMSGAVFALASASLLKPMPAWGPWFSMAVGNLGSLLPGAPGAVGTFHYFAALGLLGYGADWDAAVATVIIVHALLWLPTTAVGLVCLLLGSINKPCAS